jgi:hypothetical protein
MNYKLVEESTGLKFLHFIVNPDSMFYKRLSGGENILTEHVKELGESFELVLEGEEGILAILENKRIPLEANALVLSLGNSYIKDGKEYCKTFPVKVIGNIL